MTGTEDGHCAALRGLEEGYKGSQPKGIPAPLLAPYGTRSPALQFILAEILVFQASFAKSGYRQIKVLSSECGSGLCLG